MRWTTEQQMEPLSRPICDQWWQEVYVTNSVALTNRFFRLARWGVFANCNLERARPRARLDSSSFSLFPEPCVNCNAAYFDAIGRKPIAAVEDGRALRILAASYRRDDGDLAMPDIHLGES